MRPEYLSDIYYDVVIAHGVYEGWKATYVGLGRMKFIHPNHEDFKVNKGMSDNWMRECWEDFLTHVEKLND